MCGIDFVTPFQGWKFCCHKTQGVALGYHVIALSARGETGTNVFQSHQKFSNQSNLIL
jgi:hypothetical protein